MISHKNNSVKIISKKLDYIRKYVIIVKIQKIHKPIISRNEITNMEFSSDFIRTQLLLFKPFVSSCSLERTRQGQDRLGALMASSYKDDSQYETIRLDSFEGALITPPDVTSRGIILYLHGGGYTCGDLKYACGFGTVLAAKCGVKVFAPAYRLAPESPFPAAVDDALEAYRYLLRIGYLPSDIILCGESAGGGLIYSLCLKLRQTGENLPAGIIAISPWSDLTLSGQSYETNKQVDPSLEKEKLEFYANSYIYGSENPDSDSGADRLRKSNPLVSPLFGDLVGLPPSIIFVGGDEILLDDSRLLHEKLIASGARSQLIVTPKMWHVYPLYCLKEHRSDFDRINAFLRTVLPPPEKLRWMRLDNAAKIYPAARSRTWVNIFRLSATLNENIDREILKAALDVTVRRFPSIAVRLRRGFFWYYLEEIPEAPEIMDERSFPLSRMPFDDIRKCAFRVLVYKKRIAVEFFHSVTDGNGGLIFLKTLLAEYLQEKYNITVSATDGVLDRLEEPSEEEFEDSFQRCCGPVAAKRSDTTAYKIKGTRESDSFLTDTAFLMSASQIKERSKEYGVTATAFIASAALMAIINIQKELGIKPSKMKPSKVLLPVNLRSMFNSRTLRNFVLYVTPEIDPRLGEYSFDEICKSVHHQMGLTINPKHMMTKITTNIRSERIPAVKILPLFIKNPIMKAVFSAVGEKKSCLSLSNLGLIRVPEEMSPYIERMDFVLGIQSTRHYNCGMITYGDTLAFNIIRNIKEPVFERHFYAVLKSLGIKVKVESNQRETKGKKV